MKIKQLIEAKIKYLEGELENLKKNLYKVEKGIIPNDNTVRVCQDCGTRNLHYYVDTNNWCCACC
jgi:ribosomal protein S6